MRKKTKQNKKYVKKVIVSMLLIAIVLLGVWSYFYFFQPKTDIHYLANLYFMGIDDNQQIGRIETNIEYDENCAFAIEYPSIGKEEIDTQIKSIIENLKQEFKEEYKEDLVEQVTENPFSSITYYQYIGYESYMAPEDKMGLVLLESQMSGESNVISEKAYTYFFDLKTGQRVENKDIFKENYKEKLSEYTKKYFKEKDTYKEVLGLNFEEATNNKEENFNKYVLTKDKLYLYFDKYEVLPGNFGIVKVEIPYEDMKEFLKINIKDTKDIPNSNIGIKNDVTGNYIEVSETVYAKTYVNIRASDTTDAEKKGLLGRGEAIQRIGIGDNGWSKVTYKEETAYISSTYLVKEKPVEEQPTEHKNVEITVEGERKIDPSKPMVALTFDDGPNPKSTPRILDTLEKYNAVATFFDLGTCMSSYPKVTQREAALGCEVGTHTYSHQNLNRLSAEEIQADINKAEEIYQKTLGKKPTLLRPPYGNANSTVKNTLEYPLINWDIDTLDWKSRNVDSILEEIHEYKSLDGRVILMHSIYGTSADAVEKIVPELIAKGYQLVTVSELAKYKGAKMETGKIYYDFR